LPREEDAFRLGRNFVSWRGAVVACDCVRECLRYAWESLRDRLCNGIKHWDAAVKVGTEKARAITRAGMGTFCDLSPEDHKHIFSLFKSEEAVIETCASVVEEDLGLGNGTLPRDGENS
jgi:hypothetical protein